MLPMFFEAVEEGNVDLVRQLLQANPAFASASDGEKQAIHLAAKHNQAEIVSLLLKYGADVNVRDFEGNTPLHLAADNGPRAVAVLVQHKADLNAIDGEGSTPLLVALTGQTSGGLKVSELLRSSGAVYGLLEAACIGDLGTVKDKLAQDPSSVFKGQTADRLLTVTTCVGNYGTTEDRVAILDLLLANGLQPNRRLLTTLLIQPIPSALKVVITAYVRCLDNKIS